MRKENNPDYDSGKFLSFDHVTVVKPESSFLTHNVQTSLLFQVSSLFSQPPFLACSREKLVV